MAAKKDDSKTAGDVGEGQVQAAMDVATDQGFHGTSVDPTPNENYSVAGVVAGKPTPETHYDSAVAALKARVAGAEGVQPPSK